MIIFMCLHHYWCKDSPQNTHSFFGRILSVVYMDGTLALGFLVCWIDLFTSQLARVKERKKEPELLRARDVKLSLLSQFFSLLPLYELCNHLTWGASQLSRKAGLASSGLINRSNSHTTTTTPCWQRDWWHFFFCSCMRSTRGPRCSRLLWLYFVIVIMLR